MEGVLQDIYTAILEGQRVPAREGVQRALAGALPPEQILAAMVQSMEEVGRLFEDGEYYIPEMLISARAMQESMEILKPHLLQADVKPAGKVVAGTIKGDLHDIGKNLVCMMLEGAGFEVIDLGADVSPEKFIAAVIEHQPDLVAMSALLTTTMPNMKTAIEAMRAAGVRDQVKVMVGGAPMTEAYARQVGADGYSPDAPGAVKLARALIA